MRYYIHGYLSNPESTKGKLFKEQLQAKPVRYRDCKPEELIVSDCLDRISQEIKDDDNAVLIGSSFGGFLAATTAVKHTNVKTLILLNPAIIPPYVNLSTVQGMPPHILSEMKDDTLFNTPISATIYILLGTKDEIVPNEWSVEFAKAQEASIQFYHDDHQFTQNIQKLPKIITHLINQKN